MRIYLTFILFFSSMGLCISQVPYFDYYYRSPDYELFTDAAQDEEGSFYLLKVSSVVSTPEEDVATSVVKLNAEGNFTDIAALEPQHKVTNLTNLLRLKDGHFLATGWYKDAPDFNSHLLMVKFDKALNTIWAKSFKSELADQYISEVKYSRDSSHLLIVGSAKNSTEGFFARVSLNGDSLEQHFYNFNTSLLLFFDILEFPSNKGYYIFSFGARTPADTGNFGSYTTKLIKLKHDRSVDTVMIFKTSHTYGPNTDVHFNNNVTAHWLGESAFIVGGRVHNSSDPTPGYNADDLGIVVWDTNGTELSYGFYGKPDTNEFSGTNIISFIDSSSVYLAGTTKLNTNHYADEVIDYYLLKADGMGRLKWERSYSNGAHLIIRSVLATADGGALMVGSSYKEGVNAPLERDAYALKVDSLGNTSITAVGIDDHVKINPGDYDLSPNPFSSQLKLTIYPSNGPYTFEVFDALGRKVLKRELSGGQHMIHADHLKNGLYLYTLSDMQGKSANGKIIRCD